MVIKTISKLLAGSALCTALFAGSLRAEEVDMNMAKMQAMDKITGMVRVVNVPVNSEVKFGTFSIVVRACKTRPPEETPENFAFVDVVDNYDSADKTNIFKGWMVSSSPALHAIEHPIYDIWLLQCIKGEIPGLRYMTEEELQARDTIVQAEKAKIDEEYADINKLPGTEVEDAEVAPAQEITPEPKTASESVEIAPVTAQDIAPAVKSPAEPSVDEDLQTIADSELQGINQEIVAPEAPISDGKPKSLINIQPEEAAAPEPTAEAPQVLEPDAQTVLENPETNVQPEAVVIEQNVVVEPTQNMEPPAPMVYETQPQMPEDQYAAPEPTQEGVDVQPELIPEEVEENGMLDDQLIDFEAAQ